MSEFPLKQLYRRFDPEKPADDSARAERPRSPAEHIVRLLADEDFESHFLLTGTVGTGKTTELRRIAEARDGHDFVVFLDLVEHFSSVVGDAAALPHIKTWEILFLASLAILRAAEEAGVDFSEDAREDLAKAWRAAAERSSGVPSGAVPTLDVGQLGKAMLVLASTAVDASGTLAAGLKLLPTPEHSRWTLPLGQSTQRLPDQSIEVQTLLRAFNAIVSQVQLRQRRVLLIVDGLDRIDGVEAATQIFVESSLLARVDCAAVITGPFALYHHPMLAEIRGLEIQILVNEPVLEKQDPSVPGQGVEFMCELYRRRVEGLPEGLIDSKLLEELAYHSGGRARDFVKLVRGAAQNALIAGARAVDRDAVTQALGDLRLLLETGLTREDRALLRSVMEDRLRPEGQRAWTLLRTNRLLPYPNESPWFYPHPLLMQSLLRQA